MVMKCDWRAVPLDELDSLERDAARYRWLKEQALNPKLGLEAFVAIEQLDHVASPERIDATIDAAMLKTPNDTGNGQAAPRD